MAAYIFRRLLVAVPTFLIIVALAFILMRLAPGGPFDAERPLAPEIKRNIMAAYHMDKSIPEQLLYYLGDLARGELGPSMKYKDKSVAEILAEGFPVSAIVGVCALVLASVGGAALGAFAALRQNKPGDYTVMAIAMAGICIPPFVVGPILSLVFGIRLQWLPAAGLDPLQGMTLSNLLLPIITLALPQIAIVSRLMRASMIETLRSNFIRTARAKGMTLAQAARRHGLRAAILPLVSYLGPAAAGLVTGSVVIEQIFQLPGIGRQFVLGALQRDYTVVMGVVILYAGLILLLNLLADVLYAILDPRVRLT